VLFLYRDVLKVELPFIDGIEKPKRKRKIPVVFVRREALAVLNYLNGTNRLMATLLYGSGMRITECVRLRIKDIDFDNQQITIREGKGEVDRMTMLPRSLIKPLCLHLEKVRLLHQEDLNEGFGEVYLAYALERKYPAANKAWGWQYVFPSSRRSVDPRSGKERRHHVSPEGLQRAVHHAICKAGIIKHASCNTFRHSFDLTQGRKGAKNFATLCVKNHWLRPKAALRPLR
jgi:integron integrase